MEVFEKMWPEAWGVRMGTSCGMCLWRSWEQPSATLRDVLRILSDSKYRKSVAASLQNETVKAFLTKEFDLCVPKTLFELMT
jgi:hypothetical protein